jgi:hypothetical protein
MAVIPSPKPKVGRNSPQSGIGANAEEIVQNWVFSTSKSYWSTDDRSKLQGKFQSNSESCYPSTRPGSVSSPDKVSIIGLSAFLVSSVASCALSRIVLAVEIRLSKIARPGRPSELDSFTFNSESFSFCARTFMRRIALPGSSSSSRDHEERMSYTLRNCVSV